MDKKQFFESFVSILPDNSGHRLDSFTKVQNIFTSIKSHLSDNKLQNEFEQIEKEALFRLWMFDRICNGEWFNNGNEETMSWPLIVISVSWEILFVNRDYCRLSGLSPFEIQSYAKAGTLYDQVYEWTDLAQANEAVSRLQAGKGYKHLELIMKHSGQKISWNSYGWIGESLEVRSGREIHEESNQEDERERFYRGNIMNSTRLIENLYQVSVHGILSKENEQHLMWIQEFLSMFDFLWNHSGLFMEIIHIPTEKNNKLYGLYNTIYAQFLKYSFQEQKKFKDIFSIVHGSNILESIKASGTENTISAVQSVFHQYNKRPVAQIYWQHSVYPYEMLPWYKEMFSIGVLVRKIGKRNIFVRIFQYLFRKAT